MPPRPTRRILLPPAVAGIALAAVAACSDATTAPAGAIAAPRAPLFAAVVGGVYGEAFTFPEANAFGEFSTSLTACGLAAPAPDNAWACVAPLRWKPDSFDIAIHLR